MKFYDDFIRKCTAIGKTPTKIAEEIGINSATVSNWKKGGKPNNSTVQKINAYFENIKAGNYDVRTVQAFLFGEYVPTAEEWQTVKEICRLLAQAHQQEDCGRSE